MPRRHAAASREKRATRAAMSMDLDRVQGTRARRRTDDDLPVSSFADLMAHLATQTMNVVAVPGAPEAAFTTISKPTALQEAAFGLLGVESMCVQ